MTANRWTTPTGPALPSATLTSAAVDAGGDNQHAPDENIRIANLWYGIDLWAALLTADFSPVRQG